MTNRVLLALAVVAAALLALWYFMSGSTIGGSAGAGYTGSPGVPLDLGPVSPGGSAQGIPPKWTQAIAPATTLKTALSGTRSIIPITSRTTGMSSGTGLRKYLGI